MDSSIPAFLIFFGHRPVPTLALCRACSLAMVRLWEEPIARHKVHSCALAALGISLFGMTHLEDSSGRAVATCGHIYQRCFFGGLYMCHGQKLDYSISPMVEDGHPLNDGRMTIALTHIQFFNHDTHE